MRLPNELRKGRLLTAKSRICYNETMKTNFTIGVFAVIFDEQKRVLLCHRRDYDLWNFPGGGLSINEAPWEGVIREVKEETGLDVRVVRLAGIYSKKNSTDIVFSFLCQVVGGEMTLTDEADRIEYFSSENMPKNTSPKHVERIKDILEAKDETLIMKTQEGQSSIELAKQGKL